MLDRLVSVAVLILATQYTLPNQIHWIPDTTSGVPAGSFYANLHGRDSDACGQLQMRRFPNGFVYPWHVNHVPSIITVLRGTLVLGFDQHHSPARERALPAGSIIQGLATEPHYGRAIGETIFEAYVSCHPR